MKFAHRYKLLKDVPGYKAGRTVGWDGNSQKFYFKAISEWKHDNGAEGIYSDREGPSFTVEQTQDTEWFKPISKMVDFIPVFPSRKRLEDFVVLMPEPRLVNDVDECRAIDMLLANRGFQDRLYEFYKTQYNAFHKLKGAK